MSRLRPVLHDLWRTFFADPVRENAIRTHGGPTAVSMIGLGIAAFGVAVIGVVLAPRLGSTPISVGSGGFPDPTPGNPATVPSFAFPVTMGLIVVIAVLAIFGATYARPLLAWVAVAFVFLAVVPLGGFAWQFREFAWLGYVSLPVAAAVPLVVLGLRLARPAPPVTQIMAALTGILAVLPAAWSLTSALSSPGQSGGVGLLANQLHLLVTNLVFLIIPVVLMAGAGAVSFGRTVTDFLARSVDTLADRSHLPFLAVLLALLLWRVGAAFVELVGSEDSGPRLVTSAGLAAFFAAAAAWWAWATRGFDETADEVEEGSSRATPAVAVLVLLVPVLSLGIASLLPILEISVFATTRTHGFFVWVAETVGDDRVSSTAVVGTGVLLVAGAAQHARRRPSLVAAWLGIVGTVVAVTLAWGTWVDSFAWAPPRKADYALAATVLVAVATVRELVRWRSSQVPPTPGWLLTAFSALALTALVAQETFLDDPFRPLLGFTGAGLVFFGVVWGFLTAGAHSSATGLPGLGRTSVMLAYAVLTTVLVAWGDAVGGTVAETLSGPFAEAGQVIFGNALLVAFLAVWLPILFGLAEPAVRNQPPPADPRTDERIAIQDLG